MAGSGLLFVAIALSCGGATKTTTFGDTPVCSDCTPTEPASADFRHGAKHIPLPNSTPQEIDVNTILSWAVPPPPASNAPRTGRELQLFHIANAFAQSATIMPDCDIHIEISQTADKNAPRVLIETPVDQSYCSARQTIEQQFAAKGFIISSVSGELAQPLPIEVLGLAFEDFEHTRGSPKVATPWELHPAIANLTQ